MHKIILGDSQAIFRTGTAKVLAMEEDFRIVAQCSDTGRVEDAMRATPAAILLLASALRPDFQSVLEQARRTNTRTVVIAEYSEGPQDFSAIGADGIVYRNISGPELVECMRTVIDGKQWVHQPAEKIVSEEEDIVGTRVRERLTPKELKITALIVQGCKNKEIAIRLGTTEQVIKNYLRSIYDKTGVSDRLELALFTLHHHVLADAAAKAVERLELLA